MFARSRQENNIVGGSVVGRDLTTNNNFAAPSPPSQIERLYEALRLEAADRNVSQEFIEQLQHFMEAPPSQASRSLADKLRDTGRTDLIETAEVAKERATKKIMRFQTSGVAQEIFAYVLGELHSKYLLHVRPLIVQGASRAEIDSTFEAKVISPVVASMQPSPLGLTPDLIVAMLFYLAGNCHVRWD